MSENYDKLTDKLDTIENQIISITSRFEKLLIEYERNKKILDNFVPKVGQKRKRWQSI